MLVDIGWKQNGAQGLFRKHHPSLSRKATRAAKELGGEARKAWAKFARVHVSYKLGPRLYERLIRLEAGLLTLICHQQLTLHVQSSKTPWPQPPKDATLALAFGTGFVP